MGQGQLWSHALVWRYMEHQHRTVDKGFVLPSIVSRASAPGVGDFVCTHGKPERGVWMHEPAMEVRVKPAWSRHL